ncbi:hypothetical protein [Dickeya dianthicola]|uniref:hypothetical protein n=1 Tax=Dickeya dianthicola TaxID=204039 RepID=UPI00039A3D19|nr:hypothetical protein [Dickeya dianthicola]ATO33382.1 hypothetical protein DDI_2214 [Dickeya dianthicola RNS04.9]MCI4200296.1 hypothetical protein [Dickeya dianthicola]MCI4208693.1 hypothetical protein [Dickeya dianthicola]MCI4226395.1 hypothetical protein [Dickeya dianthicola]MCI4228639.1 hypothetical protein [Dickeya dianthicola]
MAQQGISTRVLTGLYIIRQQRQPPDNEEYDGLFVAGSEDKRNHHRSSFLYTASD